jgi:hypothetical protein
MNATVKGKTINSEMAAIKLEESRRQLEGLLITWEQRNRGVADGRFPRSKAMRLVTSARGGTLMATGLLVVGAGGLLVLRPKLLTRALRAIPLSLVLRMAATRFINGRN